MKLSQQSKRLLPFYKARIKSWVIDHLLILSLSTFIYVSFYFYFINILPEEVVFSFDGSIVAFKLILSFSYLAYFFFMNYYFQGKTIGQLYTGIGSINNYNFTMKQLSAWSCIQRSAANYICFKLYFIFFLIPLINKNQKSFADIVSNTHQTYSFYQSERQHQVAA